MAKLTESYLRNMIKQVMNEMYDDSDEYYERGQPYTGLKPVRSDEEAEALRLRGQAEAEERFRKQKPFKNLLGGSLPPEKDLERMDKKNKPSAFDDKYFGEGKPWEEAVMNLESVMADYEMGSMTAEELTQAADDLAALIASAPKSRKAQLSKLIADAHNLSSQEPMYESRRRKLAPKRR
jgi:hypothetical protein